MSDPRNPDPTEQPPDLTINHPEEGSLTIDAGHDPGCAVLGVKDTIEPEDLEPGTGYFVLHTADMVKIRAYLDELINRDVELSRDLLADPEATEENRTAARRILDAAEGRR